MEFTNGSGGIHSHGFSWGTRLRVVRTVPNGYGCRRYVVADGSGRRAYATGPEL